jgi:hypothetical protein
MATSAAGKSLKEQNRLQLWLVIAANVVVFYFVLQWDTLSTDGLRGLFATVSNLLPIGLATAVTTVLNGVLTARTKERLVFLRWRNALPGHRAFSEYGPADPKVDMAALKKLCGNKLPSDPAEQNLTWFSLYKSVENHPAITQVHKDYLLTRDYAGFAAIFLVVFGATAVAVVQSWRVSLGYCGVLLIQFLIVRHSARTYGIQFIQTVLAQKSAAPAKRRGASAG